jgi:hypothetical protein
MQRRISYSSFLKNGELLYRAFNSNDPIERTNALDKLVSYFG